MPLESSDRRCLRPMLFYEFSGTGMRSLHERYELPVFLDIEDLDTPMLGRRGHVSYVQLY